MEKKEKSKFGKSVLWVIFSYVAIYAIALICWAIRGAVQGESTGVTFWMIVELFLVPVLFVLAGYLGTVKYKFDKFKSYKVWLFAALFSGVLLALWYFGRDAYVLLNLPAAEGVSAIDMFLRRITVVQNYTVLYLYETEGYAYGILPLLHFVMRIVYWLLYLWGNRMGVSKEKRR